MKIYNTLSRTKTEFQPITPGKFKLYVCGLTVYAECHLGHARLFLWFDIVVRYLRSLGFEVTYVRNITDVDDKIIKRAHELNITCDELTAQTIAAMHAEEQALGLLAPTVEPRVTQHIPEIIALIQKLIDRGYAYQAPSGDICYRIAKFVHYGELAHQKMDELIAGARVDTDNDKENPLDFVLWKSAKPGEPAWDTPWGSGRPGWHIECSAMAQKYLGDTLDLHGGGMDLVFPHHQNEIAQSEAATGKPLANFWMHIGYVEVNHAKMSKSLHNFSTIKEIRAHYHPEVLRYLVLASHYRSPINFSYDALDQAEAALRRLYLTVERHPEIDLKTSYDFAEHPIYQAFHAAMQDDFNTPEALAQLFELARIINSTKEPELLARDLTLLVSLAKILGLFGGSATEFLRYDLDCAPIEALINERSQARALKNWSRADELRQQLTKMGIALKDTPSGTSWYLEDRQLYLKSLMESSHHGV